MAKNVLTKETTWLILSIVLFLTFGVAAIVKCPLGEHKFKGYYERRQADQRSQWERTREFIVHSYITPAKTDRRDGPAEGYEYVSPGEERARAWKGFAGLAMIGIGVPLVLTGMYFKALLRVSHQQGQMASEDRSL